MRAPDGRIRSLSRGLKLLNAASETRDGCRDFFQKWRFVLEGDFPQLFRRRLEILLQSPALPTV